MMLRSALLALALLAACSDPGPRDRSLARRSETFPVHPDVFEPREAVPPRRAFAAESNVGLEADELAPYYPKDARLVVRFTDLESLNRHARERLADLSALLPGWGLPELPPGTLLRVHCAIPEEVVIDHGHPFAYVESEGGWIVVLPIDEAFENSAFLRRVEGRYCVAGTSEAVTAYAPGGRQGHYLPGDISVLVQGDAVPELGARLTAAAARTGISLPGIRGLPGKPFDGIGRVDLALRCLESTVRADLRVVPDPERANTLATLIAALDARRGRARGRLPSNGALTLAAGCDVASLLTMATAFHAPLLDPDAPVRAATLQYALAMLGDDTAVSVQFDERARPTLLMAADLTDPDRRTIAAFLGGEKLGALLAELGGEGHTFSYEASDFEHRGTAVGTIHGLPAPEVLAGLQAHPAWGTIFARLFAREGRTHLALAGNRLCVAMGEDAPGAIKAILDRGRDRSDGAAAHTNGLSGQPLLEGSLDAAVLLSLARSEPGFAAPGSLPVGFAIAAEGDALRLAVRMPLQRILAAWSERDASPAAPAEAAAPTRD